MEADVFERCHSCVDFNDLYQEDDRFLMLDAQEYKMHEFNGFVIESLTQGNGSPFHITKILRKTSRLPASNIADLVLPVG